MANKIAMVRHRLLVAWVGHRKLRVLAANSHPALKNAILALVKWELPPAGERGPIRSLIEREPARPHRPRVGTLANSATNGL